MSEWVNQIYHHEFNGDCFSVRVFESGTYVGPVPWLCILKDNEWYPVAKFNSWKRALEFCRVFEEQLNCTDVREQ